MFKDTQYDDMFENGNFRRRRRMKRPYRSGAHYAKMFQEPFVTGAPNFQRYPPYQNGYARFDAG